MSDEFDTDPLPPTPASIGATIAERYRLVRCIGEGGMGQVYEAEHLALGRSFALKVLRLEKWSDELIQRFNREARSLARISSPRVAQVTDYGIEPRIGPYYVMELVEGETLEHRIDRVGSIGIDEAVHLAAEACEALGEVHDAGIVHRDVKPSNLGLPRTGPVAVKLLDFGLAASVDDSFMQRLTRSQQVLGSLPYMAPEQFHGARPRPEMDLYAIGVVLFEMLAGRLPFKAPSTAALIHQILAAPVPSFKQVSPNLAIPARVEQVVKRLLSKDPAERYPDAREAAQAIRDTAEHSLATTLPGRVQLPPTRYTPEITTSDLDHGAPATADTVAVPTPGAGVPAVGGPGRGWSSQQVVPPTSYASPAEAPRRGRGGVVALVLGGGLVVGALTAVAIVLLLQSAGGGGDELRAAGPSGAPTEESAQPLRAPGSIDAGGAAADGGLAAPPEAGTPEERAARDPRERLRRPRASRPRAGGGLSEGAGERTMREPEPTPPPTMRREDATWSGELIETPEF